MSDAQTAETPGMGDNNPPSDLELLKALLAESNEERISRKEELLAGVDRMPKVIEDQEIADKAQGFVSQIQKHIKACEDSRKATKEPYHKAGKMVDTFYKTSLVEPLIRARDAAKQPLAVWTQEQERIRREAAELEARKQRQAERILREKAEKAEAEGRAFAAEEARKEQEEADKLAAKAEKKVDNAGPIRSAHGGTASTTKKWVFEIKSTADLDLETLRPFFSAMAFDAAVRAYVHAGGRELKGATITEDIRLNVR